MSAATTPDAARPWLDDQPVQGPPVPPEWLAYYAQQQEPDRVTRFVQRVWTRSPIWAAPLALLVCMGGAVGYTLATHPAEVEPPWAVPRSRRSAPSSAQPTSPCTGR